MRKKLQYCVLSILFLFSTLSCINKHSGNKNLPLSNGLAGEILIVIDKAKWQSSIGDTIRRVFSSLIPITLMDEPYFSLVQIQNSKLTSGYNRHGNIFIVEINDTSQQGIYVKEDQWSSPQIVVILVAPNIDAAIQLLTTEGEVIRNKFINTEIERWMKIIKHSGNPKISIELRKKHKYWLLVPKDFSLDVNQDHFFWISKENQDVILGVIGWDYPFTSCEQLKPENLIKKRNEFVKSNVPGPLNNSFMTTDLNFPYTSKETIYKGRYLIQIEGLWKLQGAFMGGPFINYTTLDDENRRIITVEGFVNAPGDDKRNLLRQLAAVLYSIQVEKSKTTHSKQK
jgi:hypothetical protein